MFDLLHSFHPSPILFKFGPASIHWYGFLMVVGGLLGYFVVLRLARHYQLEKRFFSDLFLYFIVGAVIGARIYYVIYAWEFYKNNLLDVVKIWEGGLAIHGIMIGGFFVVFFYCRLKKQNVWLIFDLAATGLAAAQFVGRVGNYFNQEIFGLPTNLAWGIPIDFVNRPAKFSSFEFFHPTFLYESLGNLLIFAVLLLIHRWRIKKSIWSAGNIFAIYLILYSLLRFGLEFLRTDYSPLIFGVRWAQVFSVAIIIAASGWLLKSILRQAQD
ncbi:prolipoprotein diacylglyceryl transferase [Candidatus Falkowbacteria bacterium]|nr:prolipoprotein diacylglyceryl transferase [Candidatus Falkowbacteria bacterium]